MIFGIVLLFGLIVGSFLNVCIARIPLESSIISPPSHCPRCKTPIRWYDNIPLVSFAVLRGRCRTCGTAHILALSAGGAAERLLFLWAFSEFGFTGEAVLVMALCSSLVVITFIDLDHQIIPDVITYPGMVIGLVVAPFFMSTLAVPLSFGLGAVLPPMGQYGTAFLNAFIGLVLGGAPLYLIGLLWEKLRKVEAMGGGDVKYHGHGRQLPGMERGLSDHHARCGVRIDRGCCSHPAQEAPG